MLLREKKEQRHCYASEREKGATLEKRIDSDDEQDLTESQRKKKRCHRHTPQQIEELEAMFKMCPHPDEKQRMQLSWDLELEPRQIKFWFQNRRTQMKAQHEKTGSSALRAENDWICFENISIREALRNIICSTCGSTTPSKDPYFDEQKMRMENAWLKEEAAVSHGNLDESNKLILQESCTDASGLLVVYASIDLPSVNIAMSGEDPLFIPLLPSGFVVMPDGKPGA